MFTVQLWLTFLISRSHHEDNNAFSLLLHYKLIYVLTGARFLLFLFYLWKLRILLVEAEVSLLVPKNQFLLTFMLLWES